MYWWKHAHAKDKIPYKHADNLIKRDYGEFWWKPNGFKNYGYMNRGESHQLDEWCWSKYALQGK